MAVKQHHIGFRASDDENQKIRRFTARFAGGQPDSAFIRDLILGLAEQAETLPLDEASGRPVLVVGNGQVVRISAQADSREETA